jgi:hypothetical protein
MRLRPEQPARRLPVGLLQGEASPAMDTLGLTKPISPRSILHGWLCATTRMLCDLNGRADRV